MTDKDKARVIDLNHTLTLKAQEAMRDIKRQHKILIENSLANRDAILRLYHADLILLAAISQDDITTAIASHLPEILDVAAARLLVSPDSGFAALSHVSVITAAELNKLTRDNGMFLGPLNSAQQAVCDMVNIAHPKSVAFVRLPEDLPGITGAALLMLAGKETNSFTASHGTDLLEQLVMKIAVAILARPQTSPNRRS